MTVHIADRTKIASFAAVALSIIGFIHFASGLTPEPVVTENATHGQSNDLGFEQISLGRNVCCLMLPDDWTYWDR